MLAIVNANRPDTGDIEGALEHINAIEQSTGLFVTGIVNNTHLLRETTSGDIIKGHAFCEKIKQATGKDLVCDCYPKELVDPVDLDGLSGVLMPMGLSMGLYMRPTWLDN